MALTKATYSMVSGAPGNILDYGADVTGVANSSAAIQAALNANSEVVVPAGLYRCDAMIEINANKSLKLMGGATLKRFAAGSASTDPVIWIKGSYASLRGAGQGNSVIRTENKSPNGVVLIGHFSMTASHDNVLNTTVSDLLISGSTQYGQTTGAPDVALHIQNPQINNLAVYFQSIDNLLLQEVNYGLWLHGWANGNLISRIHGYKIGNTTLGVNKNAFIYCNGALDNAMTDAFFHFSPDSIGMLVDSLDNTPNGSPAVFIPYANSFKGLVFEQGGASAYGLKILSGSGSYYEAKENTALGSQLYSGFFDSNLYFGINQTNYSIPITAKQRDSLNTAGTKIATERYLSYSALTENFTYKVVDIPLAVQTGAMVEVDFSSTSGGGLDWMGGGTVVYTMERTLAGTVTANALLSRYSGTIAPCDPIIAGGTVTIVFKIPNNGTATSTQAFSAMVKVVSGFGGGDPVFYTTSTVSGTAGTPLANNI